MSTAQLVAPQSGRSPVGAGGAGRAWEILVTDSLHDDGVHWLREAGATVRLLEPGQRSDLAGHAARHDALIIRTATRITDAVLAAAPRVRVVGRAGVGLDNVDVEAARLRGVAVVNAPEANAVSAAEHTFALLLALARGVVGADRDLKSGRWVPDRPLGTELAGKCLGIVGFGRIGQRVAARARAFEMPVLVVDPVLDEQAVERIGVGVAGSFEELLGASDVVSFHVPLDDTTRCMLDGRRIELLRRGALVINCARGGVVDERALLAGLESGIVTGAGLDVFEHEPPLTFELAGHPRVVATPHWGAHTAEAKRRVALETARNVLEALEGGRCEAR